MLNIRITKDGYVEGYVFDKYDYDLKIKYKDYKSPAINTANNGAALLRKIGRLEYYYYFVPIRFKY